MSLEITKSIKRSGNDSYIIANVESPKNYSVMFTSDGYLNMRLSIRANGKRKILIPPYAAAGGAYKFIINAKISGELHIEDRIPAGDQSNNWNNLTEICVEEV